MAGWKVFYGEPFKYTTCSSMAAMQYKTDEGRFLFFDTLSFKSSRSLISGKRYYSVLAVQSTKTLSVLAFIFLMSSLIFSMISWLVPWNTLSHLSAWLAAIKSGLRVAYKGTIYSKSGFNYSIRSGSRTRALLDAS